MGGSGDSIVKGLIEIYDEATLLGWLPFRKASLS